MAKIPSTVSLAEKNKYQEKILPGNVTSNGDVAVFEMQTLEIGKFYTICANILLGANITGVADNLVFLDIMHDGVILGSARIDVSGANPTFAFSNPRVTFQATATTVTFNLQNASAASYMLGNGTRQYSFVTIEERNDVEITDKF